MNIHTLKEQIKLAAKQHGMTFNDAIQKTFLNRGRLLNDIPLAFSQQELNSSNTYWKAYRTTVAKAGQEIESDFSKIIDGINNDLIKIGFPNAGK